MWRFSKTPTPDASEQHIVNCCVPLSVPTPEFSAQDALHYLKVTGTTTRSQVGFTGTPSGSCDAKPIVYRAHGYAFVDPDHAEGVPTVASLKAAFYRYGPLVVYLYATNAMLYNYPNPPNNDAVFCEDDASGGILHVVALVGWDDNKQAWLIKNSWGPAWGIQPPGSNERGYMWIRYGSNSVGLHALCLAAEAPVAG